MDRKPPPPVCRVFLICRQIVEDQKTKESVLIGQPTAIHHHIYPTAKLLAFFTRWTSAHGAYQVELQLQHDGEVVWRDGPPQPWRMADPLGIYDLKVTVSVIFPQPGTYDLVLFANGDEIAREKFHAHLTQQTVGQ
jgi:hypothetical protein